MHNQNHYRYWQCSQVLLKFNVLVRSEKHIKLRGRKCQKFAIFYARPSRLSDRNRIMTDEQSRKVTRKRLVKQDAHRETAPFWPVRVLPAPFHD